MRRSKPAVLAGYPMVDVAVALFDGSFHDVDSSEMAFKIAGSMAVKDAAQGASPVLLEPVMEVEVGRLVVASSVTAPRDAVASRVWKRSAITR